jgi:hypothetical protein
MDRVKPVIAIVGGTGDPGSGQARRLGVSAGAKMCGVGNREAEKVVQWLS